MNQEPRQRCDWPFVRAAGFLVTVMVQIISRIPPTSSDSLVTIPPPVIGIQDEAQQRHAELDTSTYPTGLTIPDSTMKALSESGTLTRHEWHPDWNYSLKPATNQAC